MKDLLTLDDRLEELDDLGELARAIQGGKRLQFPHQRHSPSARRYPQPVKTLINASRENGERAGLHYPPLIAYLIGEQDLTMRAEISALAEQIESAAALLRRRL